MKNYLLLIVYLIASFPSNVFAENLAGKVIVVEQYLSDQTAFTQGFELSANNDLVIATGLYGESIIGELDLKTGQIDVSDSLDEIFFGEGITFTEDYLWQVTWENELAFKRDKHDYSVIETYDYDGMGWGLAYDPQNDIIWMSNGSHQLLKRDSDNFELLDTIDIYLDGLPLEQLNELEYANGYIYANVWFQDLIYQIDPNTKKVLAHYDIAPIIANLDLTEEQLKPMNVLNGIAHIKDDYFYITGKNYPFVLEVRLEEPNN